MTAADLLATDLSPARRAEVLMEALPHIHRFTGAVVVVKYGGNAMSGEADGLADFAGDIALLAAVGVRVVVVHGGGPQIGALMTRLGKEPTFVDGLRVTDAETLEIARMVLVGSVNRDLVGALNVAGATAVGPDGQSSAARSAAGRPRSSAGRGTQGPANRGKRKRR